MNTTKCAMSKFIPLHIATDDDDWVSTKTMGTAAVTLLAADIDFTHNALPWIGRIHLEHNHTSALDFYLKYINPYGSTVEETISVAASGVVSYTTQAVAKLVQLTYPAANTKVFKMGYDTIYWLHCPEFANIEDDEVMAVYLLTVLGGITTLTVSTQYTWNEASQCIGILSSTLTAGDAVLVTVDCNW